MAVILSFYSFYPFLKLLEALARLSQTKRRQALDHPRPPRHSLEVDVVKPKSESVSQTMYNAILVYITCANTQFMTFNVSFVCVYYHRQQVIGKGLERVMTPEDPTNWLSLSLSLSHTLTHTITHSHTITNSKRLSTLSNQDYISFPFGKICFGPLNLEYAPAESAVHFGIPNVF